MHARQDALDPDDAIPQESAMYLFKSELLRESPRPAPHSYARPAFGPRYARRPAAPAAPACEKVATLPRPSALVEWPSFDRAA